MRLFPRTFFFSMGTEKREKMVARSTERARAHERAARMYSRFGDKRKALAHAKRARSLRFGTGPVSPVSVSQEEYARLVALRGKPRESATLTDTHGGTWVAMSVGSAGVLMEPTTLPDAHPLHDIGPLLIKIVTRVVRVTRVTRVTKATKATTVAKVAKVATSDEFSDEETPAAPLEEPENGALFPQKGSVEAELAMMSLPKLRGFVPATYGLVTVDGTAVGYAIERFETSLREHIIRHGMDEKTETRVYAVIQGVCAVVSCFDIKPDNMVVSGSDVRMIDFGPDFCATSTSGVKTQEHVAADVAMCTLLFCLSACKDKRLLPLPFLTSKLLDKEHTPLPSAVASIDALGAFYPDEGTIYTRAIENVQTGPCFAQAVGKRRMSEYTARDLLTILSQFKKAAKAKEAGQAGFGRERREPSSPKCAIL